MSHHVKGSRLMEKKTICVCVWKGKNNYKRKPARVTPVYSLSFDDQHRTPFFLKTLRCVGFFPEPHFVKEETRSAGQWKAAEGQGHLGNGSTERLKENVKTHRGMTSRGAERQSAWPPCRTGVQHAAHRRAL